MIIEREVSKKTEPLLDDYRYKGLHGGRGGGKSHFFAEQLIEDSLYFPGLRSVCVREVQKTLEQSAKRLITDKLAKFKLGEAQGFKVFNDVIETPGDGIIIFNGMQNHNADSIKSLEGFDRLWAEESQTLSDHSLKLIRPTIRVKNSQLWFSWNPTNEFDAVDVMFRSGSPPTDSICVEVNWRDNPWFPDVLEPERLDCKRNEPDDYEHIWEGDYKSVSRGAYYSEHINTARREGRIGVVPRDPLIQVKLFVDIGGTGRTSDAFVIWAAQFVGHQIRVINHYEVVGQDIAYHLSWMRENNYTPGNSCVHLPHDGRTQDRVLPISYESSFKTAGYNVKVTSNQGSGAAMMRVKACRRAFGGVWFDQHNCAGGLKALGAYHEKWDEKRNVGLGPEHDWASHSADAFGLMCIVYETDKPKKWEPINYKNRKVV